MGNPAQQSKGSTPKIPASPEVQDQIRRAAKARRKKSGKGLASANSGLFDAIREDKLVAKQEQRQQQMEENVAFAMNDSTISSLREGSLMHQAVMTWFNNYAITTPGQGCFQKVTDKSSLDMRKHTYPAQQQDTIDRGFKLAKKTMYNIVHGAAKPKELVSA